MDIIFVINFISKKDILNEDRVEMKSHTTILF